MFLGYRNQQRTFTCGSWFGFAHSVKQHLHTSLFGEQEKEGRKEGKKGSNRKEGVVSRILRREKNSKVSSTCRAHSPLITSIEGDVYSIRLSFSESY